MALGDDVLRQTKVAAFSERVRARLAAMNKTMSDLARDNGTTPQALGDLIRRGPYLHYESLEKIAKYLAVEVTWLIAGDPREAFIERDSLPQPF